MHTEAMPRQYKIVASGEEMKLIAVALAFASSDEQNSTWTAETKAKVLALCQQVNMTMKQA